MIKGTVTRVHKNGRFYSILVDEVWYGVGSNKPDFDEGVMVEFEATKNGRYWNADPDTINVLGKAKKSFSKPQVSGSRVAAGGDREDYWKNKEARDIKNDKQREIGASRNTAIAFVELLLKTEALKLPAKQADKADAVLAAVEYYTNWFMTHAPDGEEADNNPVPVDNDDSGDDEDVEDYE